jgi:hypothetical protein
MVAHALKGESLVPIAKIEVNNIHSCGGCVVLHDAAERHQVDAWLAPLSGRNASLVRAMIFGGLLMAPSVAPFFVEARTWRLAAFCGLDEENERFDAADLTTALNELDTKYPRLRSILLATPPTDIKGVTALREGMKNGDWAVIGMDAQGVPIPMPKGDIVKSETAFAAIMRELPGGVILALDEEMARLIAPEKLQNIQYVAGLGHDAVEELLRSLDPGQLKEATHAGRTVEVQYQGRRHVLIPAGAQLRASDDSGIRMGSLNELSAIPGVKGEQALPIMTAPAPSRFFGAVTNIPLENLSGLAVMEWAHRAEAVRAAFSPIQVVIGSAVPGPDGGEALVIWRNHRNLQFITHRLRCMLHAEWSARGESRPVEEVLRDLQEVHRATITVDGEAVRRMASNPSAAVRAMMERIGVMPLFETPERKGRSRAAT